MNDFQSLALKAIEDNNMLSKGDAVIVALSGGADSVSLLNFLISIKDSYSLHIFAAHVNHNLRGDEAIDDENFVRELCANYGIKLYVKSVDVSSIAKSQKISTELCGRNIRYEFLEELSVKYNAKIATAHTASDNAETLIFNLARGAGLKGMTGIQPVRDNIIRPLIYVTREQVEEYCSTNNLKFVTDSSNLTDDYTRNKIRHQVIPLLKEFNQDFEQTSIRHSMIFSDLNSYIDDEVKSIIDKVKVTDGYNPLLIDELPKALKHSVIYAICKKENADVEFRHITEIASYLSSGGATDLPGNYRCVCKQNLLRIVPIKDNKAGCFVSPFDLNSTITYCGKKYSAKELKQETKEDLVDISFLNKNLILRTRKSGDTFTFPRRKVTKTVKKLFNELKIPEEKRNNLLLLTLDDTVLWIEGIGVSKQGASQLNHGFTITVES